MAITSCRTDEKFELNVHSLTEEQLQELAKTLGLSIIELKNGDGKGFKTVSWSIGQLIIHFYT
jgi:hypothetical protein